MLCQIQQCLEYCIVFNRCLVLDTLSTRIFSDQWDHFFSLRLTDLPVLSESQRIQNLIECIEVEDVINVSIYHSLKTASVEYSENLNFNLAGFPLTFNFSIDYPQKFLLHHQCGGGNASHLIFKVLSLQPHLVAALEKRLSKLPCAYDAIHSRNTDMKSNLREFHIPSFQRPFFLSTDSTSAKNYISTKLPKSSLFFSESYLNGDSPLHEAALPQDIKRVVNENAILDLLTLGMSIKLYVTNATSGYSSLALFLNRNPQAILNVLQGASPSFKTKVRIFLLILLKLQKRLIKSK
jgi:hypothetical protein